MRVEVDISDSSAPLKFATALAAVPVDEPVRVSLGDAGGQMAAVDLWAESHEDAEGNLRLDVAQLAESLGTRDSAERVRHLVENAIDNDGRRVVLDFAGVESCSSAFADELVGKLVERYDFAIFLAHVAVRNLKGLAAMLVNSTLKQRIIQGGRTTAEETET